ncbi:phosphatase PAP2 family protein [Natrinema versiforme]|uniref:Phosphoesterase PA-phosphatase-related protein n=1 Tax=Natrinema versiforme JCM 10478 TaxID=1227496 RepID=L9YBV1_9EURY|nr:phosphatase PAP2 family protein [Natrinema versiforme]ELY71520.1 phosphoesterase PA-phosphatase-related protein [Natrinema versiforme JCM 10478]
MYRGATVLEAIHDLVPAWAGAIAAAVTQLGDGWFLLALGIGASWAVAWQRATGETTPLECDRPARRPDGPWVVAVIVGGLAVMTALKHLFALPRPDLATLDPAALPSSTRSLYASIVNADGYGFPSGHAVGATVTYGLFALVLEAGTRRLRLAAAAVIVAAVCLTRLVLGVHYPLDVVAGVAVGGCYLAAAWRLLEHSPFDRTLTAFALALGLAGTAMIASGRADSAVEYVAFAAGGLAGWLAGTTGTAVEPIPLERSPTEPSAGVLATVFIPLAALVGVGALSGRPKLVASAALLGLLSVLPAVVFPRATTVEAATR